MNEEFGTKLVDQGRPNAPGLLIVLEGLDSCGKSSQVTALSNWLGRQTQLQQWFLKFPDYASPSGQVITQYLQGKLGDLDPVSAAALFATNRIPYRELMVERLQRGWIILCDRYAASNIAFQCARVKDYYKKFDLHTLMEHIEYESNGLPRPDITIQLEIPPAEALRRSAARGRPDKHEAGLDFQRAVQREYDVMAHLRPASEWLTVPVYEGHWLRPTYLDVAGVHGKIVEALQHHPLIQPLILAGERPVSI